MNARLVTAAFLLCIIPSGIRAFSAAEHRLVSAAAFDSVVAECDNEPVSVDGNIYADLTFGSLCSLWSEPDMSFARFHEKEQSVLSQLRQLSRETLVARFDVALSHGGEITSLEIGSLNVVANYLIHHFAALRLARMAAETPAWDMESVKQFLAYEARAQTYLVDAFSSGHMLVPSSGIWNTFLCENIKAVHNHFRSEGIYTIDSRGQVRRIYGDRLMQYYPATHEPIARACRNSLREVCLVYYASLGTTPDALTDWASRTVEETDMSHLVEQWTDFHSGDYYYTELQLPALLDIPVPITATWSARNDSVDELGVHGRTHYPQPGDDGLHDPSLAAIVSEHLYELDELPHWMQYEPVQEQSPAHLIREVEDVASVRYIQQFVLAPSYKGFISTWSGSWIVNDRGDAIGPTVGAGWGIADDLLLVAHPSVEFRVGPTYDESDRFLIMVLTGLGVTLPGSEHLLRIDGGYIDGVRAPYTSSGMRFGVSLEFASLIRPGFVYLGISPRIGYQWLRLERTLHGPMIELVFH